MASAKTGSTSRFDQGAERQLESTGPGRCADRMPVPWVRPGTASPMASLRAIAGSTPAWGARATRRQARGPTGSSPTNRCLGATTTTSAASTPGHRRARARRYRRGQKTASTTIDPMSSTTERVIKNTRSPSGRCRVEQGEGPECEGHVGGHGNPPPPGAGGANGDQPVQGGGHRHPAQCAEHRGGGPTPRSEFADRHLPSDLQSDDDEEDGGADPRSPSRDGSGSHRGCVVHDGDGGPEGLVAVLRASSPRAAPPTSPR